MDAVEAEGFEDERDDHADRLGHQPLTGVFAAPGLGGTQAADYVMAAQLWVQVKGVLITIVWSGIVSFVAYKIVDMLLGMRVSEDEEREGLDISSHGESAYHL